MNRFIMFFSIVMMASACSNGTVEKPDNLISEDEMTNIIYDMAILQALKLDDPLYLEQKKVSPAAYIAVKYNVDSLQFAQNDRYYASQIDTYKKIYDNVALRINQNKKEADSLLKIKPETPTVITPVKDKDTVGDKARVLKGNLQTAKRRMLQRRELTKK